MYLSVPFADDKVKVVNHDPPNERVSKKYDARWEPLMDEWTGFPEAAHDDILDAIEMGLRQVDLGTGIGAIEAGDAYGRGN